MKKTREIWIWVMVNKSNNFYFIKLSFIGGNYPQQPNQPNINGAFKKTKRTSENKKLVFLSKKVLEEVSTKPSTTGTSVSN